MSSFSRNESLRWHEEVPGSRWFPADLHIHTLDDHPNPRLRRPACVHGPAHDAGAQQEYARALLKHAAAKDVQVLGLTPHAVQAGNSDETSATWRIVDVWNNEEDDDGVPFRDKIYAVFPGFEPDLADGAEGLHLLFLFDPEAGRQNYVAACAEIMGAVPSYDGSSLRISTKQAEEAFASLDVLQHRLDEDWQCLCLAPHAFGERGLFSLKSQILEHFPHEFIRGLQLKDDWLADDAYADKSWLKEAMTKRHQAFFHASDAYAITDIGRRVTLVKLASPRIESLRQAFLAGDTRVLVPYAKRNDGSLGPDPDALTPVPSSRPWLRGVSVKGGTSFFGGRDGDSERTQSFKLSPDLTCVIGGSMSGKSTFLDGLRVHFDGDLPTDAGLKNDVLERGRDGFLSGTPKVDVQIRGPVPQSAPLSDRWPAVFFTQRELRGVVDDQETRRHILHRLIPSEAEGLIGRETSLIALDQEIQKYFEAVKIARAEFLEAQDKLADTDRAQKELERFEKAGIHRLISIQDDQGKIGALLRAISQAREQAPVAPTLAKTLAMPDLENHELLSVFQEKHADETYQDLIDRLSEGVDLQRKALDSMELVTQGACPLAAKALDATKASVQQALVDSGGSREDLNQFEALLSKTKDHEQAVQEAAKAREQSSSALRAFAKAHRDRQRLVQKQREAMHRVAKIIYDRFDGRIQVACILGDLVTPLDKWIKDLATVGVTRWWNTVRAKGMQPEVLRWAIRNASKQPLQALGMSPTVEQTFLELMGPLRRMQLASLRSEDSYTIELRVDDVANEYRDLGQLSGGAQVSVLLSLILETDDTAPLVVDQPEEEADKDFLLNILLPALRKLKCRRQVILATHDANIVVNGDADQVVVLNADARKGMVVHQGAIDHPAVRRAIVTILDGGQDAFSLRKLKYGF